MSHLDAQVDLYAKRGQNSVAVAMLGSRMHYAIPRILHAAGLLDVFFTDSYLGSPLLRKAVGILSRTPGAPRILKMYWGRYHNELRGATIKSFDIFGIVNALERRRISSHSQKEALNLKKARIFADHIDRSTDYSFDMIWGFKGAALEVFENARQKGCFCIYEQSILPNELAYAMLQREYAQWADWTDRRAPDQDNSPLIARERSEWNLADHIVAPSAFVRDGLVRCGVASDKVSMVPYGVYTSAMRRMNRNENLNRPLRILFAGEVGLRKGAPYLLQALKRFKRTEVQARFAGNIEIRQDVLARFSDTCSFLGHIPRDQMRDEYEWADLFVLPSIVEGSATVIYEALARGLPVLTTPNAGSTVTDDLNGTIVQTGDTDAIHNAIRSYLDDPLRLSEQSEAASQSVDEVSFDRYRDNILELVGKL